MILNAGVLSIWNPRDTVAGSWSLLETMPASTKTATTDFHISDVAIGLLRLSFSSFRIRWAKSITQFPNISVHPLNKVQKVLVYWN